jgi:hypothetical protein
MFETSKMKQTRVLNPRGLPDFCMSLYWGMYPITGANTIKHDMIRDLRSMISAK